MSFFLYNKKIIYYCRIDRNKNERIIEKTIDTKQIYCYTYREVTF